LTRQGAEVLLAGEGAQEQLLRAEFPGLEFLPLQGYRVRYARTGPGLLWNLLYQTPGILRAIREEQRWLKQVVTGKNINAVISDNRYGLYHAAVPCIFITHQLAIKTPWGKWTDQLLQKRNYGYIEKFSACWVPDSPGPGNLAGELSHPVRKPRIPLSYIGILSRFSRPAGRAVQGQTLFLVSGPEPQRTRFEELILKEIEAHPLTSVMVRGLPGHSTVIPSTNTFRSYNHLPGITLQRELEDAEWVVARSGYSSIMDLARTGKKSILVPTPGQTEQEYLGHYLFENKKAFSATQSGFSLAKSMAEARKFNYELTEPFVGEELRTAVQKLLAISGS
jgi:hypothetical protein